MSARVMLIVLTALLAALQYRLWLSPEGLREVWRLDRAVAAQRGENAALTQRNQRLDAEVADLRSGLEAVEERARNELGMIRRNESFFQMLDGERAAARGE